MTPLGKGSGGNMTAKVHAINEKKAASQSEKISAKTIIGRLFERAFTTLDDGRVRWNGDGQAYIPGTASFRCLFVQEAFEMLGATGRVVDDALQILATDHNRYRVGIIEADATDAESAATYDAQAALVPDLYVRGEVLSQVVHRGRGATVRDANAYWLRSSVGVKMRDARGNLDLAPMARLRAWEQRGAWPALRQLDNIVCTPFVRRDGSLCVEPGYDAASRTLFAPTMDWGHIDESPTLADVESSVALITDLISGFEFDGQQSRAAVWSAILCLLQPELWPIPMHIFDATSKGSGKTLLASMCASIGTGVGVGATTCSSNPDEFNKALAASVRSGARVKLYDNAQGSARFGTSQLASYLTSPRDGFSFRILGVSEERTIVPGTVIFVSGNNTTMDEDLGRRSIMCRQEPKIADPSSRTGFKHDLVGGAHMRPERLREIVGAALTILLWHTKAGRPSMNLPAMGSYDAYTKCVRDPLALAGIGDPHRKLDSIEDKTVDPKLIVELFYSLWRSMPRKPSEIFSEISRAMNSARKAKAGDDRRDALLELGSAIATIRGKRSVESAQDVGYALTKCRDSVTLSGVLRRLDRGAKIITWCVENASPDLHIVPDMMMDMD